MCKKSHIERLKYGVHLQYLESFEIVPVPRHRISKFNALKLPVCTCSEIEIPYSYCETTCANRICKERLIPCVDDPKRWGSYSIFKTAMYNTKL